MKMIDMKGIRDKLNFIKEVTLKKFNAGSLKPTKIDLKNFKFDRRAFLISIGILIVLAVFIRTTMNIQKVLFKKKSEIAAKAKPITFEEEATAVKAYKVKRMDFKDTLPALGNVKGFKENDLKFQVAGIIESFNFEEGEKIQEGDIIASLIQKDALLKLKYSEIELTKNKKLFEIGAIAPLKMDQSKLEYESAKSDLDKTNIYAMSSGLMGPRMLDVGSYATPNDRVGIFVNIWYVGIIVFISGGLAIYNFFSKKLGMLKDIVISLIVISIYPVALALTLGGNQSPRRTSLFIFPIWLFLTVMAYEIVRDIVDAPGDSLGGPSLFSSKISPQKTKKIAISFALGGLPFAFLPFVLKMCGALYLVGFLGATFVLCCGAFLRIELLSKALFLEILLITVFSLLDMAVA